MRKDQLTIINGKLDLKDLPRTSQEFCGKGSNRIQFFLNHEIIVSPPGKLPHVFQFLRGLMDNKCHYKESLGFPCSSGLVGSMLGYSISLTHVQYGQHEKL